MGSFSIQIADEDVIAHQLTLEALGGRYEQITDDLHILVVPDCVGSTYLALFGSYTCVTKATLRALYRRFIDEAADYDHDLWALAADAVAVRFLRFFGFEVEGPWHTNGHIYTRMVYRK